MNVGKETKVAQATIKDQSLSQTVETVVNRY